MPDVYLTGANMLKSVVFTIAVFFFLAQQASSEDDPVERGEAMMDKARVVGIGGIFFRAKDPGKLSQWYEEHLGVSPAPTSYDQSPWIQQEGPTVFAPFSMDTEYFGARSQSWMINFRVDNLEVMVSQLREAGIEVEVDPEEYPNGYFARLYDPEGNPIQLWQPD